MQFKKEVQEQFKKAGWSEGRNIESKFDKKLKIDEYPIFAKEFLFEYGDLIVSTLTKYIKGTLNLGVINSGFFEKSSLIQTQYGNVKTYAIGYYDLDNTTLECDDEGNVYMSGDFPCLVSNDFKTGIEKVIMEDYSETLEWNPETKKWVEEY